MGAAASSATPSSAAAAACDIGAARASELRGRLSHITTEVDRLDREATDERAPSFAPVLSELLREVRAGQQLLACDASAQHGDDAALLDKLHARLWRLHARMRKSQSAAGSSAPPRSIRLLALGDSITDGGAKQRSYRYHLHTLLARDDRHSVRWLGSMHGTFDRQQGRNASAGVVLRGAAHSDWPAAAQAHEGHWGWTSRQLLRGHERQPQRGSLHKWLRALSPRTGGGGVPDVTLLHIGTNDLTKLVLREHGPREPVAAPARRVNTIMRRLCEANPRMHLLIAAPIIPYCRASGGHTVGRAGVQALGAEGAAQIARRRAAEAEYTRRLAQLCDGQLRAAAAAAATAGAARLPCADARVACVNMSAAVSCEMLVHDGIHPAAMGARRMAAAWYRVLRPRLQLIDEEIKLPPAAGAQPATSPEKQ